MSLRGWNYCLHVQRTVLLLGCTGSSLLCSGLLLRWPVAERGPWGTPASVVVTRGLQSTDSKAVVPRLSCSTTYGIFLHLGSNPCLLRGQTDSHPPYHQRSPRAVLFMWCFQFMKYPFLRSYEGRRVGVRLWPRLWAVSVPGLGSGRSPLQSM